MTTIVNRATADTLTGVAGNADKKYKSVQLWKAYGNLKADADLYITTYIGDTLKLTSVDTKYKMDSTLGYFMYDSARNDVQTYRLKYYNVLDATREVGLNKDSVLCVMKDGDGISVKLYPWKSYPYGAAPIDSVSKQLYMQSYWLATDTPFASRYVMEVKDGKYIWAKDKNQGLAVYFKEMERKDGEVWYVITTVNDDWGDRTADHKLKYKVSVDDTSLELYQELVSENRTSMFALMKEDAPKYRRLGATITDGIAKDDTAYVEIFKANEPSRFLYENSQNIVAANGTGVKRDSLNFLGMYNQGDMTRNAAIFVDTAYVRNDTIVPLYMLALGTTYNDGTKDVPCPDHGMSCEHATHANGGASIAGRYLVALSDSTDSNASAKYQGNTRLAFVDAKHTGDTLVIARSKYTGTKDDAGRDSLVVSSLNEATFAFELVNKDETSGDFYMKNGAGYVRIHNGVPVLVDSSSKSSATVFNIGATSVRPTASEELTADGVKIVGSEGCVILRGAAGKRVTVTNMLGQRVATEVASADEARIAAPAGVVVVAVEGEMPQKTIVK